VVRCDGLQARPRARDSLAFSSGTFSRVGKPTHLGHDGQYGVSSMSSTLPADATYRTFLRALPTMRPLRRLSDPTTFGTLRLLCLAPCWRENDHYPTHNQSFRSLRLRRSDGSGIARLAAISSDDLCPDGKRSARVCSIGTYEGTFTLSQVTGEHQISLTFQRSGPEVIVTYRSVLGGGIGGVGPRSQVLNADR
jgi:hypothetical protein